PLFPEDYFCDVQVLISLVSSDEEVMPDALACLAASAALSVSDIPIKEVISEVRIARVGGEFIVNPTRTELDKADMECIIAAKDKIYTISKGGTAKHDRSDAYSALRDELIESLGEEATDLDKKLAKKYYADLQWEVVRNMILDDRIRLDGRQLEQVRPLAMEV